MMKVKSLINWLAAILACVSPVVAQESSPTQQASETTQEFAERYNKNFLKRQPLLDTQLKDVAVFDESGRPVDTHTLRDSYTVLVFGCLT